MYIIGNPKSKKALREMVARGEFPECYQPGPFGPDVPDGVAVAEGPHYPQPHRWYARCLVKNGRVIKVLG